MANTIDQELLEPDQAGSRRRLPASVAAAAVVFVLLSWSGWQRSGAKPAILAADAGWAAAAGWVVGWASGTLRRGGVRVRFGRWWREEQGSWLLAMFGLLLAAYGSWLLGQWPAAMTYDSLQTWSESTTGRLTDDHPFMYTVLIIALRQLYDSPAVVGVAQVLASAFVVALGLWQAVRMGVRRWIVAVVFLFYASSLPIGLYNVMHWKDVPFAIGLSALSLYVFVVGVDVMHRRTPWRPSWRHLLAFAVVLVLTSSVRHNGIPLLVVFPGLLLAARLWQLPRTGILGIVLIVSVFGLGVAKAVLRVSPINHAYYEALTMLNPATALLRAGEGYYSPDRADDFAVFSRVFNVGAAKEAYTATHNAPISEPFFNRTASAADYRQFVRRVSIRCAQNPSICSGDRMHMFVATLVSLAPTYGLAYGNLLDSNVHRQFSNAFPETTAITKEPKAELLARAQDSVIRASLRAEGFRGGRMFIWNTIPALLLLVGGLLLSRWFPSTALSVLPALILVVLNVVIAPSNNWRYYYFAYFYGSLVPLLLAMERRFTHRSQSGNADP